MTGPNPRALVVALMMGMGHLRAAYPLRHLGLEGVLIYGSKSNTPEDEYRIWRKTKPSELVFYSGLGLPIIMAPPIGTHEELNKRWLQEIHAGVKEAGPAEYCHEWLFDLRETGRLAEAAWDGFLKVRKLGTFKIERLVCEGTFNEGQSPLEE